MDTDTNITKNTTSRPLSSCYVDTKHPSFNKALIIPICGSTRIMLSKGLYDMVGIHCTRGSVPKATARNEADRILIHRPSC